MEERSKEEILSELYAIRATMSLVLKNQSAIDECDLQIKKSEQSNQNSIQRIANANREKEARLSALTNESRIGALTYSLEEIEKKKEETRNAVFCNTKNIRDRKDFLRKRFSLLVSIVFFFVVFGICLVVAAIVGMKLEDSGTFTGRTILQLQALIWLVPPIPLTILFALIYRAIAISPRADDRVFLAEQERELRLRQAEMGRLDQESLKIKNEIQELQAAINRGEIYTNLLSAESLNSEQKALEEREEMAQKAELQQIDAKKLEMGSIAEKSQEMIENARKLYSVIDFRDWENVDRIIFYYETGRAETLKEALQQVDRQRQNEAFVEAIDVLGAKLDAQNERLEKLSERAEELRLSAEAQANIQAKN